MVGEKDMILWQWKCANMWECEIVVKWKFESVKSKATSIPDLWNNFWKVYIK